MRVVLVSRYAWPHDGGVERTVRTLANGLSRRGWEVNVVAQAVAGESSDLRHPYFAPVADPDSGVIVSYLGSSPTVQPLTSRVEEGRHRCGNLAYRARRFPHLERRLQRAARWLEVATARTVGLSYAHHFAGTDIVHRFGGNPTAVAVGAEARRQRLPFVITPMAHPGLWDDDELSGVAYTSADAVIGLAAEDADVYRRMGVSEHHLHVCEPPTQAFEAELFTEIKNRYSIPGHLVLFLGARREHKGVTLLLDASRRLVAEHPDARVAFVGPGAALPSDTAPNVLDIGPVDEAERNGWLAAADIVCVPSAGESYSLVVSEAWSAGKPVVTSDLTVLAGRVERSGGGLAVPRDSASMAGAIGRLLTDADMRHAMGASGYDYWKEHLSTDHYLDWHEGLYAELMQSRSGPHRGRASGTPGTGR